MRQETILTARLEDLLGGLSITEHELTLVCEWAEAFQGKSKQTCLELGNFNDKEPWFDDPEVLIRFASMATFCQELLVYRIDVTMQDNKTATMFLDVQWSVNKRRMIKLTHEGGSANPRVQADGKTYECVRKIIRFALA